MLCSLSNYKTLLGLGGTDVAADAQVSGFLEAASAVIQRYCNQNFEAADYTEYHTGSHTQKLVLRQLPVRSVTGVWINNSGFYGTGPSPAFPADQVLSEGADYVLDRRPGGTESKTGILYRIGSVWPMLHRVMQINRLGVDLGPAWGNIKVTYSAGYLEVPQDLQYACALLARSMLRTLPTGGYVVGSEKIGDYSYRLSDASLASLNNPHAIDLSGVKTILAAYKEVGW